MRVTVRLFAGLRERVGEAERVVELPDGDGGPAEATFANGQLALRIERGPATDGQTVAVVHRP